MTAHIEYQAKVRELAIRIAAIKPKPGDHGAIALLGLMTGVLYSLKRATALGFSDDRMKQDVDVEGREIHRMLEAIEQNCPAATAWLAGYYLDSAIFRIGTFCERVKKYAGRECHLPPKLYETYNAIKHQEDAGLKNGWETRIDELLHSTETFCGLLEKVIV